MSNTDPFGIEKMRFGAKGTGLRIPKPPKASSKAGQYARRAKRGAKSTFQNATSRPAKTGAGERFGRRSPEQEADRNAGKHMSRRVGYIGGTVGGTAAGVAIHSQQSDRDRKVLNEVYKARAFKITNLGTKASSAKRPGFRPGSVAGGAAVGAALPYSISSWDRKDTRNALDNRYKQQERKKKKAASVIAKKKLPEIERYTPDRKERAKMRGERSAKMGAGAAAGVLAVKTVHRSQVPAEYRKFRPYKAKPALVAAGLGAALGASGKLDKDQYRVKKRGTTVAKNENKASTGRLVAGATLGPYHGLVAGKKGRKLRAAGNEFGGAVAGNAAGALVGGALSRGKLTAAGSVAGTYGGAAAGTARAQRMGHFKPQKGVKKSNTFSAFGIDHGY